VDKTAKLWNRKGEMLANYGKHRLKVNSAVFSIDGQRILTASDDGFAIIWWSPKAIFQWLNTAPLYRLTDHEMRSYDIAR
jgi:WD40 repeat protein